MLKSVQVNMNCTGMFVYNYTTPFKVSFDNFKNLWDSKTWVFKLVTSRWSLSQLCNVSKTACITPDKACVIGEALRNRSSACIDVKGIFVHFCHRCTSLSFSVSCTLCKKSLYLRSVQCKTCK